MTNEDRELFREIIAERNNAKIIGNIILGDDFCKETLKSLITVLTKDVPNWEWELVCKRDAELLCAADKGDKKQPYDAKAVLSYNDITKFLGRVSPDLSPEEQNKAAGNVFRYCDTIALFKILRYRILNMKKAKARSEFRLTKSEPRALFDLLELIRNMRIDCEGHLDDATVLSLTDDVLLADVEKLIGRTEAAAASAQEEFRSQSTGRKVSEILLEFLAKLRKFRELFILAVNGAPIVRDAGSKYHAEDIYAYNTFIAFPSCENSYLVRFISNGFGYGRNRLLVDLTTMDYLEKMRGSRDPAKRDASKELSKKIYDMKQSCDGTEIIGFKYDYDTVECYTDPFCRFISERDSGEKICVITDDPDVAQFVWSLNDSSKVAVRVVDSTTVVPFFAPVPEFHTAEERSVRSEPVIEKEPEPEMASPVPAEKPSATDEDKRLRSIRGFSESSTVYLGDVEQDRRYQLGKRISAGGEGTVYDPGTGSTCFKIYNTVTTARQKKLQYMVGAGNEFKSLFRYNDAGVICWPEELVSEISSWKAVVGFSMPKVSSGALSIEQLKNVLSSGSGDICWKKWTRRDLVELCINIVTMFRILHEPKDAEGKPRILMGDINEKNIFVSADKKVFFIDTDSYQVDSFLCTVGTSEYSSPRLHRAVSGGMKYGSVRRIETDERFAVAHLIFYILFLGYSPYDTRSGSVEECITKKLYRFYNPEASVSRQDLTFCNLSDGVRKAFFDVFCSSDRKDHPEKYPSDAEWFNLLLEMKELIDNDRLSDELYPQAVLSDDEDVWRTVHCKNCGSDFRCSNKMYLKSVAPGTDGAGAGQSGAPEEYDLCPRCKKLRNINRAVIIRLRCERCGRFFTVNNWDLTKWEETIRPEQQRRYQESVNRSSQSLPRKPVSGVVCPDCVEQFEVGMRIPKEDEYDKVTHDPSDGSAIERSLTFLDYALQNFDDDEI